MIRLLGLIPEPWGSLALIATIFGAWAYGDVSGRGSERQKNEITRLAQTVAVMERQRDTALAIQTSMANRLSEFRERAAELERKTSDLVEQIRREPAAGACLLSESRRLRLQSIRIGPAGADPRAR